MTYSLIYYTAKRQKEWDDFIQRSSNGTFLHQRSYMDYHAERFNDFSLMIFEGLKLRAVLPAHRIGNEIFAHKGLTYSDFIFQKKLKTAAKIEIVRQALAFLFQNDLNSLYINSIPFVFQPLTDESCTYIYHKAGGELQEIKPFWISDRRFGLKINHNRQKNYKKLLSYGFKIEEDPQHIAEFWPIVVQNLKLRYNSQPTHSMDEIKLLINRFPKHIRLFTIRQKSEILAGALVYFINHTAHFQYIHALNSPESRQAVEFLTYELVQKFKNYAYVSFGSSSVGDNNINENLVYWKESFGCHIINQLSFRLNPAFYDRLKNVLQ